MELERTRESVKIVAKEGISEAVKTVYASGYKQKIAIWESIPQAGEVPTAEEFVAFMSSFVGLIMDFEE